MSTDLDIQPVPTDPELARPSIVTRGGVFYTPDTRWTHGLNVPRVRLVDIYIGWQGNPSGRALSPGEPIVLVLSDRTGTGVSVNWTVRAYGEARAPEHPSWYHRTEPPIWVRAETKSVGDAFQFPAEDLSSGLSTVTAYVEVFDVDGGRVGTAFAAFVIDVSLVADPASLLPVAVGARTACVAVETEVEVFVSRSEATSPGVVWTTSEVTPAVRIAPLQVG